MKSDNVVKIKSYQFAIRIVHLYKLLVEENKEYTLSKQLLRSGTSIGANVREAEHAESKADFIHKLSMALKEANETEYWLDLLKETGYLNNSEYISIQFDIKEILKLLTSIIKTAKQK
ncbi:MAG: four helix bundle protein [Gelidibacter sp.]